MSDSLQEFETMFDPTILGRGREYFHQGCVLEIEEIEQGEYRAAVEGSEVYEVSVSLDVERNILDISCDCPYDWDAHCKHQAAVLFALRQQLARNGSQRAWKQPPLLDDLRDMLCRKTKEALMELLVSIARENPSLGKRMLRQLKDESTPQALSTAMWEAVHRARRRGVKHDTVAMQEAHECVEALLDAARDADETAQAVALCLEAMSASESIADSGYDEDGEFYAVAEDAIAVVGELVADCAENGTETNKSALFTAVFDGMKTISTHTWDDQLTECLLPLCSVPACRQRMETHLESQAKKHEGRNETYAETRFRKMQLDLIRKYDSEDAAARFIQDNLRYDEFRVMAIGAAMQKQDYQAALSLAQEGIRNERHGGFSWRWQQYTFDTCKAMGDIPGARKLARQFVLAGRFEYYGWLKQSAAQGEWTEEAQALLAEMESKRYPDSAYEQALVAEGLWARLMSHTENYPDRIFELHEHLAGRFPERVDALFRRSITHMAANAQGRSDYRALCSRIRSYGDVCGRTAAEAVIFVLREAYPRRPAMLDEFSKAFPEGRF